MTDSTNLTDDYRRLPMLLRILRNPVAIVLATYVSYETIGVAILGNLIVVMALETSDLPVIRLWSERGLCGPFYGWQNFDIILCRLFYSKEAIIFGLIPMSILAFIGWIFQSIYARLALWVLGRRQRRFIVLATYVVAAAAVVMSLALLPQYILFTGPIHGFHPLGPLLRVICAFITPLVFWFFIEKAETRYLSNEKES